MGWLLLLWLKPLKVYKMISSYLMKQGATEKEIVDTKMAIKDIERRIKGEQYDKNI